METAAFHKIVEQGSLEELKQALKNGADVNAPGRIQQTALMVAIGSRDLEKIKLLVEHGADPELTDQFNTTALRSAVQHDFADGVRFLLSLGVDRGFHPKYPLKKVSYDLDFPEVPMPAEYKEFMSEDEWKKIQQGSSVWLDEMGQNPTTEPMISDVEGVEVLKLFLEAGDGLSLAPTEVKRAYVGLPDEGKFQASRKQYRKYKSPRFGVRNPQGMDNPFWQDMIRLGVNACAARQQFKDDVDYDNPSGAVWCYDRFGSTLTRLDDGRLVQIAGEHEDSYDPDFHIYNDVVIHDGKGNFQIYGYPYDVFPPTDFHTATLVGDWIYIIGSLGYPEQRKAAKGRTPVCRLKLETWEVEAIESSGEMPSRLHRHRAQYKSKTNVIRLEGGDLERISEAGDPEILPNQRRYELDLSSLVWRKK